MALVTCVVLAVQKLGAPGPWQGRLGKVNVGCRFQFCLYCSGFEQCTMRLNPKMCLSLEQVRQQNYSQSAKVGRWFTGIGAWRKTSSNFKFGRLCFISSKFHVFQLWCTKCFPAGTAAFRNTPSIFAPSTGEIQNRRGHRGRAFTQAPAVPGPTVTALPQVLAGFSTRRNRFPGRNRFPPSTGSSEIQS